MTATATSQDLTGTPCRWPDCSDGVLEDDGCCDTCGRSAPAASPAAGAPTSPTPGAPPLPGALTAAAPVGTSGPPVPGSPTAAVGDGSGWSAPLVTGPIRARAVGGAHDDDIPPVPRVNPLSALLVDPALPERQWVCRAEDPPHLVGQRRDGRPGRPRGFCPEHGRRYSFVPALDAGTLVAGQYEVKGALAHGGLGWIYLAVDRNVDDRWVVLKGVLDADDPSLPDQARAERQFLAQLSHPGIVAIHNFVRHVDAEGGVSDYIVMAYIGGSTLAQVWETPVDDPARRVAHALTCMIKILPALSHLHAEGHVYCDLKPDNVMQCERRLTLIDMGAVVRLGDPKAVVFGTPGYHAPEVAHGRLSPASDLYTVGRTLAVLALGIDGESPLPDGHPMLRRHESLHRLLLRATHPDPDGRFGSAEEMAEQLAGVRREVLAVADGCARSTVSTVFTAPSGTFAPGLLLGHDGPGRPALATVAAQLPQPLTEPDDPVAEAIAALQAARDRPASDRPASDRPASDRPGSDRSGPAPVPPGPAADWRLDWVRAAAALAASNLTAARAGFDAAFATFPGELAPTLALAVTAECAGHDATAERYYARVATVDPSWADAAFGLARVRLRGGNARGAVEALCAVPTNSSAHVAAQLAGVEVTLHGRGAGGLGSAELRTAADRVQRLDLDPVTTLRMRVAVFDAAVGQLAVETTAPAAQPGPAAPLMGCAWEERALRLALEHALRELARLTPDAADRVALVDRANAAHPRTLR